MDMAEAVKLVGMAAKGKYCPNCEGEGTVPNLNYNADYEAWQERARKYVATSSYHRDLKVSQEEAQAILATRLRDYEPTDRVYCPSCDGEGDNAALRRLSKRLPEVLLAMLEEIERLRGLSARTGEEG